MKEAKELWELQAKVCKRAVNEKLVHKEAGTMSLMMDLDSVPDLDLDGLLAASGFDFAHDICGIMRHMDRRTYPGKLQNCFVPRYCRNRAQVADLPLHLRRSRD